ncbi:ABC transporter substrate-binding protein [Paenibacillus paeoniae]|uniref:Carbohydrate ABC transporter substrate-binding protein n=1 Tax=Paenibacillus paeoniae TaxID=2292705 RepID=A0A371PIY4_9BACL|nr:ABC transporter substrate-binding protein [Paenibacillus paeoniae]REK76113.1 carbohydrate ABC transporter substrate-binding protein [Paenibacillus paeoniae]
MKLSRFIPLLLILAIVTSGCSQISFKKEKEVELTIFTRYASGYGYNELKGLIEERFPNIKLKTLVPKVPLATDEEIVSLILEEKPDLYYSYNPNNYTDEIELIDLSPIMIKDQSQLSDIQQTLYNQAFIGDGKVTQLSPTFSMPVIFINRSMLKDKNVAEPGSTWTWDEFRSIAEQTSDSALRRYGYELKYYNWFTILEWAGKVNGLSMTDENDRLILDQPEWEAVAMQIAEDNLNGVIRQTHTSEDNGDTVALKVALLNDVYRERDNAQFNDQYLIAPMPYVPSNGLTTPYFLNDPFAIDSRSAHIDEASQVIEYLMSKDAAPELAVRLSQSFFMFPEYNNTGDISIDHLLNSQGTWVNENSGKFSDSVGEISRIIDNEFMELASGNVSIDNFWPKIVRAAEQINSNL